MSGVTDPHFAALPAAIGCAFSPDWRQRARTSVVALSLAFGFASHGFAGTYTVTTTGDPGPSDKISLREAVVLANADPFSTINFDPGLKGSTITLASGAITASQPMDIQGPGADQLTVKSGTAAEAFYLHGTLPVFANVGIRGMTLTAPSAPEVVYSNDTAFVLQNCVVTGSVSRGVVARDTYGGVHDFLIKGTTIQGFAGTGFYISGTGTSGGSFTVYNSTIAQNLAAGIVAINANLLDVTGSTITGNSATGSGGGMLVYSTQTRVTGSRIVGNSAGLNGGGIYVDTLSGAPNGSLYLLDTEVSGNQAYDYGGGVDVNRSLAFLTQRVLIRGNSVTSNGHGNGGGGIALSHLSQPSHIDNSTIYGNHAYYKAGGIGIFDAASGNNLSIVNSTIAANSTQYYSSNGILSTGQPTISNSIVANNVSHFNTQDMAGSFTANYSLIKNPTGATITGAHNKLSIDPALGVLAVNGGSTMTMLPMLASPVLDAGDLAITNGLDQRRLPRVANGRVDMGAAERQYPEDIIYRNGFDSS